MTTPYDLKVANAIIQGDIADVLIRVYQLVAPDNSTSHIITSTFTVIMSLVRPLYLSICAADQRYYTGRKR